MTAMLSVSGISKSYGDDTLFSDLSFDFKAGDRMGLIGANGSGKSTLLSIMAGQVLPDTGDLVMQKGLQVVYLPQKDLLDPGQTIEETLMTPLITLPLAERERQRRVNQYLGKAGFSDTRIPVGDLSGGWRKRVCITRALCLEPDLLLLDEPTNHLDIGGILWLEKILASARFSFILVSHDRTFLSHACTGIMEIARYYATGCFTVRGDYAAFEQERDRHLEALKKQQASLSNRMRREEEWLGQGAKARTTKAKYRIEQAEKLRQDLAAVREQSRHTARVDIDFTATGRQTRKLIRVHNLTKGYGDTRLFANISFELGPGTCLGVVGDNGSGKSTFLSLLEQTLPPDEGTVKWAEGLKIAVFDQTRSRLDPEATLREALNPQGGDSVHYRGKPVHIVTWARRFLFLPDQLDMPVRHLSGGEQARILLARVMQHPADLLLLDEPANDLDILTLEVLEQGIREFAGAVIIVSHDRYLMDRVCHRILYLDPVAGPGFYQDFSQVLAARQRHREPSGRKPDATSPRSPARVQRVKSVFSFNDKFELAQIEDKILEAEARVVHLSDAVQKPEILRDPEQLKHCCRELEAAQEAVAALYARWEALEEKKAAAADNQPT